MGDKTIIFLGHIQRGWIKQIFPTKNETIKEKQNRQQKGNYLSQHRQYGSKGRQFVFFVHIFSKKNKLTHTARIERLVAFWEEQRHRKIHLDGANLFKKLKEESTKNKRKKIGGRDCLALS